MKPENDPTKKPSKRQLTLRRVFVCGCGAAFLGVAAFGLLSPAPLRALMIVFAVIGLVLICCGALATDKTCGNIAEAICRDYEND